MRIPLPGASVCRNEAQDRWVALATVILVLAVFVTARCLKPDLRGLGTHEQLNLPPCSFQVVTGLPCPACGLTTSFAWTVRGQVGRGFEANAVGPLIFFALLTLLPYNGWVLISGRHVELERSAALVCAVGLGVVAVTALYGLYRILSLQALK